MGDLIPDEYMKLTKKNTPLNRIGKAQEAAALMAFLASDSSSYVNGQNIEIDGGLMQMMIRLLPRPGVAQAD